MTRYEIQCGRHHGTTEAETVGAAWRSITAKATYGFSALARFREYTPAGKTGPWQYVTPDALEKMD